MTVSRSLTLLIGVAVFAQASKGVAAVSGPEQANEVFIRACALVYKPEARAANFQATVHYVVSTDVAGHISQVVEDPSSPSPPPFRPELEPMKDCLKSWRLRPSLEYKLELRWGSGGADWSWRACPPTGGCIQVVVPR